MSDTISTSIGDALDRCDHSVQFYDDDASLCGIVADFLASGLARGEAALASATPEHRAGFLRLLEKKLAVSEELARGRLTLLDARETLAKFMVVRDGPARPRVGVRRSPPAADARRRPRRGREPALPGDPDARLAPGGLGPRRPVDADLRPLGPSPRDLLDPLARAPHPERGDAPDARSARAAGRGPHRAAAGRGQDQGSGSSQGRAPRDARARASRAPRAHNDRAPAREDAMRRPRGRRPSLEGRDSPDPAPLAARGRPPRGLTHHAGQDPARAGAPRRGERRPPRRRDQPPFDRRQAPLPLGHAAARARVDRGRRDARGADPRQPPQNAAKYTDERGRIALSVQPDGREVVFRVQDNGVGISKDLMPRLFELFAQADTSLDRSEGGLGIGLTLVRALTEMHGGSVQAFSDGPGKGSEFVVRLPLATGPRPPEAAAALAHAPRPRGCRIVIVDDSVDAAESLAELLVDFGHVVSVAHDGASGCALVRAHAPDLVLLDIGLPQLDGFEVAKELRREHGSAIKLVALTGYGQAEDRRRSKDAGFDHHLVKPVQFEALSTLIAQVVETRPHARD